MWPSRPCRLSAEYSRGQCGNAEESRFASRKALASFTGKCLLWKLNYTWDFGFPLPHPPPWEVLESYCGDRCNHGLSAFQRCISAPHRPLQHPGPRGPRARGQGALCTCWGLGLQRRSLARRPLPLLPAPILSHLHPLLDQQLSMNFKLKLDREGGFCLFVSVFSKIFLKIALKMFPVYPQVYAYS